MSDSSTAQFPRHAHPRKALRERILSLMERESAVTRQRLGEALGVSVMTARRIADDLLSEGLLEDRVDISPYTQRRTHFLRLSPEPTLLLLDAHPSCGQMNAYRAKDGEIDSLSAEYRCEYTLEENLRVLEAYALAAWPQDGASKRIYLTYEDSLPLIDACQEKYMTADIQNAIRQSLRYHRDTRDKTAVLYLHFAASPRLYAYVRESADAPWFTPQGAQRLDTAFSLFWKSKGGSMAASSARKELVFEFFDRCCLLLAPDLILIKEDSGTLLSSSGEPSAPKCDLSAPIVFDPSTIPLHVDGAIRLHRRMRWLGKEDASHG